MTSIPKSSYLDGVSFAINPIFIIDNPSDVNGSPLLVDYALNLALNYDLNKAKSIIESKFEYESEKKCLDEEEEIEKVEKEEGKEKKEKSLKHGAKKSARKHARQERREQRSMSVHSMIAASVQTELASASSTGITQNGHHHNHHQINNKNCNINATSNYQIIPKPSNNTNTNNNYNKLFTNHSDRQPKTDSASLTTFYSGHSTSSTNTAINSNSSPNFYLLNTFNISSLLEPSTIKNNNSQQQISDDINNNITASKLPSTTTTTTAAVKNSIKKFSYDVLDDDEAYSNPRSSLDPFHDMELKTINDLEELKNILANQQLQQQQQQQQQNTTMLMDSFGLPKISFLDLDLNKNPN